MNTLEFMMTVFVGGLVMLVGVELFARLIDFLYGRMVAADRLLGDDDTDPPEWSAPRGKVIPPQGGSSSAPPRHRPTCF